MASMDALCLMYKGTKRREAHEKARRAKDLYFYVSWVDEDLRDVLSAKKLVTDSDDSCSVQDIPIGSMQQFIFDGDGKPYQAKVINKGPYVEMRRCQEADENDEDSGGCEQEESSGDGMEDDKSEVSQIGESEPDMEQLEESRPKKQTKPQAKGKSSRKRKRVEKTPSPIKSTPKKRKTPSKTEKKVGTPLDHPETSSASTTAVVLKEKSARTPKKVKSSSTPKSRKGAPKKKLSVQKLEKNRMLELVLSDDTSQKNPEPEKENDILSTPSREEEVMNTGLHDGSIEDDTVEKSQNDQKRSFTDIPNRSFVDFPEISSTNYDLYKSGGDSLSSGSSNSFQYPLTPPFGSPIQSTGSYRMDSTPFSHYQAEGNQYSPHFLQPSIHRSVTWPPPSQTLAQQMADMKSLLMNQLHTMQIEIQTIKSDVYRKHHKRGRCRSQSVTVSDDDSVISASGSVCGSALASGTVSVSGTQAGMWLGNPFGREGIEKIFIPDVNRQDVRAVEAMNKEPNKFALSLVDVFFSKETLAKSLVTQKDGRERLDPDIIEGIRLHLNYRKPCDDPVSRWSAVVKAINTKCRNTKNRLKK